VRKKIGQILIEEKICTPEQIEQAINKQKVDGRLLGTILVEEGYCTENEICRSISKQLNIPVIEIQNDEKFIMDGLEYDIDYELIGKISEKLMSTNKIIPICREGSMVILAASDPSDIDAINNFNFMLESKIPSFKSKIAIISCQDIRTTLSLASQKRKEAQIFEGLSNEKVEPASSLYNLDLTEGEEKVISITKKILRDAIKEKVSDIHIEPSNTGVRIRYRVDGLLEEIMTLPASISSKLINHIKNAAGMDTADKRHPQDGRLELRDFLIDDSFVDVRLATLPGLYSNTYGEKIVMRILSREFFSQTLSDIGFESDTLKNYRELIHMPYGLILVSGPTGSGKTTTLAATLNEINDIRKNIISIEDPIEYIIDGIHQIQINPKTNMGFAEYLRSVLRQDPDIIMIGEIRDEETARIAIQAATTGHKVFGTVHSNDSAGALTRLIELGVDAHLLRDSVIGVLSQRLVRKVCVMCEGKGCSCKDGYNGRTVVSELLPIDSDIRKQIRPNISGDEIKQHAKVTTLWENGLELVKRGVTTFDELIRVVGNIDNLKERRESLVISAQN